MLCVAACLCLCLWGKKARNLCGPGRTCGRLLGMHAYMHRHRARLNALSSAPAPAPDGPNAKAIGVLGTWWCPGHLAVGKVGYMGGCRKWKGQPAT